MLAYAPTHPVKTGRPHIIEAPGMEWVGCLQPLFNERNPYTKITVIWFLRKSMAVRLLFEPFAQTGYCRHIEEAQYRLSCRVFIDNVCGDIGQWGGEQFGETPRTVGLYGHLV